MPAGLYHLEASLPSAGTRYSTARSRIEIADSNRHDLAKLTPQFAISNQFGIEFALEPTTLFGKVTSADDDKDVIGMAKVQIQGREDYTFSLGELVNQQERQWNYQLIAIEASNHPQTIIAIAKGYITGQKEIRLEPGKRQSLNLELSPH